LPILSRRFTAKMTDQINVEIFVENGISKIKTLSEIPFVF
jgi:hypothetical protein